MKMKTMVLALVASTAMTGAALAGGGGGSWSPGGSVNNLAPGSFVAGDLSNSNEMTGVGVIVNQQALLGNVNLDELEMENEDSPIDIDSLDAIIGAAGYVGGDIKQAGVFYMDDPDSLTSFNIVGGNQDNSTNSVIDNSISHVGDYLESDSFKGGAGDYLETLADKANGDILAPLSGKGNDFSSTASTTFNCDGGDGGNGGSGGDGGDATLGAGGSGGAGATGAAGATTTCTQ